MGRTACTEPQGQYKGTLYFTCLNVFEADYVPTFLHYKSEGHGFDTRWDHWNFSLT